MGRATSQALSHGLMHTCNSQQLQLQVAACGAAIAAAGAVFTGVSLLD
jgi:predicted carbohydrate-binding protein with CBM5 and CBM33 domain